MGRSAFPSRRSVSSTFPLRVSPSLSLLLPFSTSHLFPATNLETAGTGLHLGLDTGRSLGLPRLPFSLQERSRPSSFDSARPLKTKQHRTFLLRIPTTTTTLFFLSTSTSSSFSCSTTEVSSLLSLLAHGASLTIFDASRFLSIPARRSSLHHQDL